MLDDGNTRHVRAFLNTKTIFMGGPRGCPVGCVFCFYRCFNPVNHILKNMYETPFITLDDVTRYYVPIIDSNQHILKKIALEGWYTDPFANPHIYDIIYYLTRRYPNILFTSVSSGTHIENDELPRLYSIENFTIWLSVHTFQDEYRKILFRSAETEKVHRIFHSVKTVPLLSNMGDMKTLVKDMKMIQGMDPDILIFRRIDHTQYSGKVARDVSLASVSTFEQGIEYVTSIFPKDSFLDIWLTDLEYCRKYNVYIKELESQINHLKSFFGTLPAGRYLFCCPESSYTFFKKEFACYEHIDVVLVKNTLFGGSIVVGGLLTFQDVLKSIKEYDLTKYSGFIITKDMVSSMDKTSDLLGYTMEQAAEAAGIPCYSTGLIRNFAFCET